MSLITNLYADPKALHALSAWQAGTTQNGDGKYVYTGRNRVWSAVFQKVIRRGYVIAVDFSTSRRDAFKLENCREIYRSSTTLAGVYEIGSCSLYCSDGEGVSATINRIGMYSQDDWNRLQQYGLDWFDGDTMPLA